MYRNLRRQRNTIRILARVIRHAKKVRKQRLPRYKEGWNDFETLPKACGKIVLKHMRKRETAKLKALAVFITACYIMIALFMLPSDNAELRFYGIGFIIAIFLFSIPFWSCFFYKYYKVGKGEIEFQEGVIEEMFEKSHEPYFEFGGEGEGCQQYNGVTTVVVNGVQGQFLIYPKGYDTKAYKEQHLNDWVIGQPAFVFRPKHSSTSSNKIVLISTLSEQANEEYQREE